MTPLIKNNLNNINTMKKIILLTFICLGIQLNAQTKVKVDGVATVIGTNIVLDSEIDAFKQELIQQSGGKIDISDCEMLEQIMHRKLLAHHAVIDSINVSEAQINSEVQRKIDYFTQQLGSMNKVIELYGFDTTKDLKDELYRVEKESLLIQGMQQDLTSEIDITPEEVKRYFESLKKDGNLPEIGTEIEIAQIVLIAEPTEKENKRVIARLEEIKKEVEEGANFKMKAILYSDDPGVTQNSGEYTIDRKSPFIKEFKEVAFSLDEGEMSEPFKSTFGYHLLVVEKVNGKQRTVRHILMQPEVDNSIYVKTKDSLVKYRNDILQHKISFEDAVLRYSEDKNTRFNSGLIVNPQSRDTHFDLTRMDPDLYAKVGNLKEGEISNIFMEESREGEKKYKFIILKSRTEAHIADLSIDYVKIKTLALQKKKTEIIENWAKDIIMETYVKINDDYLKCSFDGNWTKQ